MEENKESAIEILKQMNETSENEENRTLNNENENKQENQEVKEDVQLEIVKKEQTELQSFSDNYRMANFLAKSTIIPDIYKGKPENVIVAIGMAQKIGLDPFTVMQNLNMIKGKTSWSGSFCRTLIEKSNKYSNLKLVFVGEKGKDSYGCYMQGTEKETGEIVKGPEVNMQMAKAERWTSNTKWINMPELMLSYRATSFFARIYVPEALNGVQTTEEIEDVYGTNKGSQKREMKDVL